MVSMIFPYKISCCRPHPSTIFVSTHTDRWYPHLAVYSTSKCVVVCGSDLQIGHSGVCLRQFCLSISVVGDIGLF